MDIVVEAMQASDWKGVRAIYLEGVATGNATFETEAPSWEEWDGRHLRGCRLVAKHNGQVVGWAALTPVSSRCVYAGVAEVSIYVAKAAQRQGIGRALLKELVKESERAGLWTLQSGIFPENEVSIALHRSCEFREVGRRERIGRLNGAWRDVVLMERRSKVVGIS